MDFTIIFQNFQRFILVNFGKENRNPQIILRFGPACVLVNDPTRGYGIFAQTMLKQARAVEKTDDTAHTQAQNAK